MMIGLSRAMTALALAPRRAFISADSRPRICRSASLLGLVSSLPPYRRISNPRKSTPWSRWVIFVLSWLKARPRDSSHPARRA